MKVKKMVGTISFISILIISFFVLLLSSYLEKNKEILDSEKFAKEYTSVTGDNIFVYRSLSEINKILENGNGIVYLGFPECPWCQTYVKYLNDEAQKCGVKKIYYCNVLEDRQNNTEEYKNTISILHDYLQYDEEGNKRLYVPAVIAISNGEIVGFDDETAWDTKGYETPEEYWKSEDLNTLKIKLNKMFKDTEPKYCTTYCNN